ncbi:sulfatase-like hydrolase/transferase [Candidatus Epulonipiscium viviparus]|uniref:sulfatase-like hydrolase/transferase n=1 Tax=Candidatus Epulonipiscium viviparus TaxID=420336 RepID=UPI00273813CB|nr:sulfatase-like hydrolase/transferase [Candidatus Epulopiscium viviparus]
MSQRPNIIFMLTDDQRYDTMGFMGSTQVYTPNLDKLAAEGSKFSNVFHVAPICMPSRASMQLGKYISQHNCGFDLPTDYTVTTKEYQESYPVLLRKNGYFTGFIGKFGFPVTDEKKHNATRNIDPTSSNDDPYYKLSNQLELKEIAMPSNEFDVWYGFTGQGGYFPNKENKFNGYENKFGDDHLTMFNAHQAEDFLEQAAASGKPFSLSLSFKAPHRPHTASNKWKKYYENITINRMPNDKPEYFAVLPEVVRTHSRNAAEYWGSEKMERSPGMAGRGAWKDEAVFQHDFKNYYGLISGVDEAVGVIRAKLDELGIADNTIIIYTSDNGYFCGSKQLGGKELLYEESIKAPLIVFDPRHKKDQWIDGLVSTVDICPTILDFSGLKKTADMYGSSIIPLINGQEKEIHTAVYGENDFNDNYVDIDNHPSPENYQSIHSKYVRTHDYKYVRYQLCHPIIEEMWNMKEDPLETNNLVGNPEYQEQLNKMRALLDKFIEETAVEV